MTRTSKVTVEAPKKKRGRPPKSATANSAAASEAPKKRGRPAKAEGKKKVATVTAPRAETAPKPKAKGKITRSHKPQRWLVIMNTASGRSITAEEYPNLRAAKKAIKGAEMDGVTSVLFAQVKGEFAFEQQLELVPVSL
jgi:hypothetical protein